MDIAGEDRKISQDEFITECHVRIAKHRETKEEDNKGKTKQERKQIVRKIKKGVAGVRTNLRAEE